MEILIPLFIILIIVLGVVGHKQAMARREMFFNTNVRDLNNRIEMFPSSIIAGMASIQCEDYFEVESLTIRGAPAVSP